ncbi:hypothetical protein L596_010747 [Steinernema carpocapsae]|uniref:DNA2/NAM7 helicase-like C-terminal domain-containing protein n=1 Tax=Steinernema carpocapsae TaxID=34508 RepID=A0A4U5PJR7_STECR|nr:hypothetical protein L596_010747 [Steinernema carpocapsae]
MPLKLKQLRRLCATQIWGPPGCGKTAVLGTVLAVRAVIGQSVGYLERTAVLSTFNCAVDNALLSFLEKLKEFHTKKSCLESSLQICVESEYNKYVFNQALCVNSQGYMCSAKECSSEGCVPQVHRYYGKNNGLVRNQDITHGYVLSRNRLDSAVFLFLTVDMALLLMETPRVDSVLVDECSALSIPKCYALMHRLHWPKQFCGAGDPRQLAPHVGMHFVEETLAQKRAHNRLSLSIMDLVQPYHSETWTLLDTCYRGNRNIMELPFEKAYGSDTVFYHNVDGFLVDVVEVKEGCEKNDGYVVNKLHADAIIDVVEKERRQGYNLNGENTVILTPYTSQKEFLEAKLNDAFPNAALLIGPFS